MASSSRAMVTGESKTGAGSPDHLARQHNRLVTAAAIAGLLFYGWTCAPGVLWQDSAMFQFRVWHVDLRGDLGLVLAHPLYVLLAKP